jgi:predicted GNAT superfamily acetyltransferase
MAEIPSGYPAMVREDEVKARAWREHSRQIFMPLMDSGYEVADFVRQHDAGYYVLRRSGD